jgi:flavodoxin
MDKSALIFFSLSGNNKKFAEEMKPNETIDVFEFAPGGFGRLFQAFIGKRGLKKKVEHLNKKVNEYKNIIIYGPIWGGKPAAAVQALINHLEVKNKTITFQISYTGNYGDTEKSIQDTISHRGGNVGNITFKKVSDK